MDLSRQANLTIYSTPLISNISGISELTPEEVESYFTRKDGTFVFARWGRPVAPVVFGLDDNSLAILKGAIEAVMSLTNQQMSETDPELGSNFMFFFFSNWLELIEVPHLDKLVPNMSTLVEQLIEAEANQYRIFRFDNAGAIRACFVFIKIDENIMNVPAQTLMLSQVVQSVLLWSDEAFKSCSPLLVSDDNHTLLKPTVSTLIRVAYDPTLPDASNDKSMALRLSARATKMVVN